MEVDLTHPFVSRPRVAALCAALTLFTSSFAAAQAPASGSTPPTGVSTQAAAPGTPAFARLVEGKEIIVTVADGREYEGVFTISGSALTSRNQKGLTTLAFDQIVRVKKASYRVRNHSLIGLVTGASVGSIVFLSACDGCGGGPYWLIFAGYGGGIGAGIGAGVGGILNAINRHNDVIYDSNRRTTTMTLAPILSPTRKGIVFSMSWR